MELTVKNKKAAATLFFLAFLLFQLFAMLRYIERLPDDGLGISLYAITIVCIIILTVIFFRTTKKKN